jgi:hypothetical protein
MAYGTYNDNLGRKEGAEKQRLLHAGKGVMQKRFARTFRSFCIQAMRVEMSSRFSAWPRPMCVRMPWVQFRRSAAPTTSSQGRDLRILISAATAHTAVYSREYGVGGCARECQGGDSESRDHGRINRCPGGGVVEEMVVSICIWPGEMGWRRPVAPEANNPAARCVAHHREAAIISMQRTQSTFSNDITCTTL